MLAYVDGTEGCEPALTLRLNNLKKGDYYILYRPDFKPFHKVKRINITFYSEFQGKKKGAELIREEQAAQRRKEERDKAESELRESSLIERPASADNNKISLRE